jgi:hypothetical protein
MGCACLWACGRGVRKVALCVLRAVTTSASVSFSGPADPTAPAPREARSRARAWGALQRAGQAQARLDGLRRGYGPPTPHSAKMPAEDAAGSESEDSEDAFVRAALASPPAPAADPAAWPRPQALPGRRDLRRAGTPASTPADPAAPAASPAAVDDERGKGHGVGVERGSDISARPGEAEAPAARVSAGTTHGHRAAGWCVPRLACGSAGPRTQLKPRVAESRSPGSYSSRAHAHIYIYTYTHTNTPTLTQALGLSLKIRRTVSAPASAAVAGPQARAARPGPLPADPPLCASVRPSAARGGFTVRVVGLGGSGLVGGPPAQVQPATAGSVSAADGCRCGAGRATKRAEFVSGEVGSDREGVIRAVQLRV